jgi:hypothetical protein
LRNLPAQPDTTRQNPTHFEEKSDTRRQNPTDPTSSTIWWRGQTIKIFGRVKAHKTQRGAAATKENKPPMNADEHRKEFFRWIFLSVFIGVHGWFNILA